MIFLYPKSRSGRQLASIAFFGALMCGALQPSRSLADELTECMMEKLRQADNETTVGELRRQCSESMRGERTTAKDRRVGIVSERLHLDQEHALQPFTLLVHKPNYILVGAHNFGTYDPDPYREQADDPSLDVDDTEAQFQISIKTPMLLNLFDTVDLYAAYTNRSFWQVYNSDESSPFRESNHEPEAWAQFNPVWNFLGFTNTANMFGIVHQSNGRGGVLSRSWNRLYASFVLERENFAMAFKPWYRLQEDSEDDDNPDITDYLGHYELRAALKLDRHVFSAMSRNNIESGFERGALELSWSFPFWTYPYVKGYVQYFTGYGESLIDYDSYVNRIGIGFALTDWL